MPKASGARPMKPKLVASLQHWRRGWEEAMHEKSTMTMTQRLQAEAAERKALQAEMAKKMAALEEELAAARDRRR